MAFFMFSVIDLVCVDLWILYPAYCVVVCIRVSLSRCVLFFSFFVHCPFHFRPVFHIFFVNCFRFTFVCSYFSLCLYRFSFVLCDRFVFNEVRVLFLLLRFVCQTFCHFVAFECRIFFGQTIDGPNQIGQLTSIACSTSTCLDVAFQIFHTDHRPLFGRSFCASLRRNENY